MVTQVNNRKFPLRPHPSSSLSSPTTTRLQSFPGVILVLARVSTWILTLGTRMIWKKPNRNHPLGWFWSGTSKSTITSPGVGTFLSICGPAPPHTTLLHCDWLVVVYSFLVICWIFYIACCTIITFYCTSNNYIVNKVWVLLSTHNYHHHHPVPVLLRLFTLLIILLLLFVIIIEVPSLNHGRIKRES